MSCVIEMVLYPHESCLEVEENYIKVHGTHTIFNSYLSRYLFCNIDFGVLNKVNHDDFDLLCVDNENAISHAISKLKDKCEMLCNSIDGLQYAFNLHNQDKDENGNIKKPHFHVVFLFNEMTGVDVENFDPYPFFSAFGIFAYNKNSITLYGKAYDVFERKYPDVSVFNRLVKYEYGYRSDRLRYLCHLDYYVKKSDIKDMASTSKEEKYIYDTSCVVASFDYVNDPDVLKHKDLSPLAIFFMYKQRFHIDREWQWIKLEASGAIRPDDLIKLNKVGCKIHRFFMDFTRDNNRR